MIPVNLSHNIKIIGYIYLCDEKLVKCSANKLKYCI